MIPLRSFTGFYEFLFEIVPQVGELGDALGLFSNRPVTKACLPAWTAFLIASAMAGAYPAIAIALLIKTASAPISIAKRGRARDQELEANDFATVHN